LIIEQAVAIEPFSHLVVRRAFHERVDPVLHLRW
jgi:hypothetical protein